MSLTQKENLENYRRAEPAVKKWAKNNGHIRLGSNGPGEGWYEYPKGYDGNVRRPRLLTGDYRKLAKKAAEGARSVYGSINTFDPDSGDYIQQKEHDETWRDEDEDEDSNPVQGNPLPEYRDIETVTLFADVDLEGDYKPKREEEDVKETVEKAIPIYVRELHKLAPNSVHVLDSGGGFYPHIHHEVTKPISEKFEGEAKGWIFDELMQRFNDRLDDISEKVEEEVIGASEILDPDTLNNKNRLMKAPLSVHRSLDIVVHPIDPDNPDFDPEPAPVTEEVVEETKKWLETRVSNPRDIETLISELWPGYEGPWHERLQQWYEEEKEKREKREKERLEHKKKMEERRGEIGDKGESIEGFPVTNCFEDILATLETIDLRDMVSPYISDERDGQAPRFDPPWRSSESGTSCFATDEKFVDINEGNTGGDAVKFAAREAGIISSCDGDLEGEKWWEALEVLRREYGYRIPIFIPDTNTEHPRDDKDTYFQTPRWAIIKAGLAFGIITEDDLVEKETEEDEENKVVFPTGAMPEKYNEILRELEERGFDHERDKKYFKYVGDDYKFIPRLAAVDIMEDYTFATMRETKDIYVYEDGVYQDHGEAVIEREVQERLGDECKNTRVKETVDHIRRAKYHAAEEFGTPPHLLGVKNGVLNLKTGELQDFDPDLLMLSKITPAYDPEADASKIEEFFKDVMMDEDVPVMQEWVGFCLWKNYWKAKALMLHGGGANGKSKSLDLIEIFLGDENTANPSLHKLCNNDFALFDLLGKLANIHADIPIKTLKKSGNFKMLTGGDTVQGEKKHVQKKVNFKNYAKLMYSTNHLPDIEDMSDAWFRRWIIIDYPYKFTDNPGDNHKDKDPDVLEDLTTDEALSGMLNWALEGLQRLRENGKFSESESTDKIKEQWIAESDSLQYFVNKKVTVDFDSYVTKENFYNAYRNFCSLNGLDIYKKGTVTSNLPTMIPETYKMRPKGEGEKKRPEAWANIKIKDEMGEDELVGRILEVQQEKQYETIDNLLTDLQNRFPDESKRRLEEHIRALKREGKIVLQQEVL